MRSKNQEKSQTDIFHTYYKQAKKTAKRSEPQSKSLSYIVTCTVKIIMTLLKNTIFWGKLIRFIPEDFIQKDRDLLMFLFFY